MHYSYKSYIRKLITIEKKVTNSVERCETNMISNLGVRLSEKVLLERRENAKKVIEGCRKDNRFYASSHNYREPWLRDMVYSIDILLSLGYVKEVKNQLSQFIKLQRKDGQMPTVIDYGMRKLFYLRFQSCPSDTEILFIIGMLKYNNFARDEFFKENEDAVNSALVFIKSHLNEHQLIPGMDWRDAMPNYRGKFLLANQMLLVDMYELLGKQADAIKVKMNVNKFFYSKEKCCSADSIYWEDGKLKQDHNFDCLGNALAVLNGTVSDVSEGILKGFKAAKTPFGYRNITPYYVFNRAKLFTSWDNLCLVLNGSFLRNTPGVYQNSAIWPFIELRVIYALNKLKATIETEEAIKLMLKREGFNEFYNPRNGAPGGSKSQLWTAAAVLSAIALLQMSL